MVDNLVVAHFTNSSGTVKLSKLGSAYMVSVEPRFGDNHVNSHSDPKKAEIDYSYYVNYFTS